MVEVKVEQGWLSGERLETTQGDGYYYSFKGVPYVAPPVGEFRFKAPRPPLPWDGVRKATEHGSKCPQVDLFRQGEIQIVDEDYLHLNVYTPDLTPVNPLPVMVFLHGGLFKSGSGNYKNYGPDFLMPHGVVFVTLNYRLEVLGFLCLNTEEVPGNAGLKDQVAALKWIRNNIENFGGDPNNVTLIGHNSGAACAALHVQSPMSKGLFNRAILMSGVPFCDWSIPFEPEKRAYILGKQLGLETDDPNTLLEFLQNVPVEKIVNTNPSVLSCEEHCKDITIKMNQFTPVVEKDFGQEQFLTEEPLEALKTGRINDVDVLVGYTSEEALLKVSAFKTYLKKLISSYNRYPELLVPRKIALKCNPAQLLHLSTTIQNYYFKKNPIGMNTMKEFIKYLSHTGFEYDINSYISKLPKVGNGRRYMYKFSMMSSRNVYGNPGQKYDIVGAGHLDDLMYLMHALLYNLKLEKNTTEYDLVQLACTVFTNFAKYGNPTPDSSLGVSWPEYNSATKAYVDISDVLTVANDTLGEVFEFWRSLYDEIDLEY